MKTRIIFSDNGSLNDISTELAKYASGSAVIPFVAADDKLYIGSKFPFNHVYFKVGTANTQATTMSVEYWGENTWAPGLDLIDDTEGFTRSGFISFTPDKKELWQMESTNYEGEVVEDLETLRIYDMYWLRISFSADMDLTTSLDWVGNLFADDDDLAAEYPDLVRTNVLTSFKAGKTNWQEQHVKAAEVVVNDLVDKGLIKGAGNIIDRSEWKNAAVSKCAEIIFRSFGDAYVDRANEARAEYVRRLDKRNPTVDTNNNAIEEPYERSKSSGWLSR